MCAPRISFAFRNDTMIAGAVAVMALFVVAPSGAMARTKAEQIGKSTSAMTDIGSANRRHHVHHHHIIAARAAHGSYVGGPVYGYSSYGGGGYAGYGYGVGDNDRNQTW
jgi:hypothetical protein